MSARKSPQGLGPAGKRIYVSLIEEYELAQHELVILLAAARTADALEGLQVVVDEQGLMQGDRVHPALVESRAQRLALARLLVSLRIPEEDDEGVRAQRRGTRGFYGPRGVAS